MPAVLLPAGGDGRRRLRAVGLCAVIPTPIVVEAVGDVVDNGRWLDGRDKLSDRSGRLVRLAAPSGQGARVSDSMMRETRH